MGCPATGCMGYELVADLNFDQNGDGSITSADTAFWDGGSGWSPIGGTAGGYTGEFEGNGHIISNLLINRSSLQEAGLFGRIGGVARNVGVADAEVTGGSDYVGVLVGENQGRVSRFLDNRQRIPPPTTTRAGWSATTTARASCPPATPAQPSSRRAATA